MYVIIYRLVCSFEILPLGKADLDPITGCEDPRHIIMSPKSFQVLFKPRNAADLDKVLLGRRC
jgi:hypothetical protein